MAANANMHPIYMSNTPHTHFSHFFYADCANLSNSVFAMCGKRIGINKNSCAIVIRQCRSSLFYA